MKPRISDENRCMSTNSIGHRCKFARMGGDSSVCYHHFDNAKRKLDRAEARAAAAQTTLAQPLPDDLRLDTAESVNALLTRVLRQVAEGTLAPRQASSIAYIAQLILMSVQQMHRDAPAKPVHPILNENPEATLDKLAQSLQSLIVSNSPLNSHATRASDTTSSLISETPLAIPREPTP